MKGNVFLVTYESVIPLFCGGILYFFCAWMYPSSVPLLLQAFL